MLPYGGERSVQRAFFVVFALLATWQLATLFLVNIELDDGYTTIVNSQYFLGISPHYFWQRGPMVAYLMLPAEYVANALQLHPLDVRPHHLLVALFNIGYLAAIWRMLARNYGVRANVLIAFVAAIPSVAFFSYAPFISHDILPGIVVLLMVKLADDYSKEPGWRCWLALCACGTFVALFKQTYVVVWASVLSASMLVCLASVAYAGRRTRVIGGLVAAAALSGLVTLCIYSWVLSASFPEVSWWLRPWVQTTRFVAYFSNAGPISEIIYQWVYLRNLSAYGILAMSLCLPGIYYCLRSSASLPRIAALTWISLFLCMQCIAFKEVRYLIFLAPLTAFILVPALDALWKFRRSYVYLCLVFLAVDLGNATQEALRLRAAFYHSAVTDFLSALPSAAELKAPVVMTERLSFISPEPFAFFGDRYHRITNIVDDQLRDLYGYSDQQFYRWRDTRLLHDRSLPIGSILIFVNDVAARVPPFPSDNRTSLQGHFVQMLAIAEPVTLLGVGDDYQLQQSTKQPVLLLHAKGIVSEPLTAFAKFPVADVRRLLGLAEVPPRLELIGFRIQQLCNISGCRSY